MAKCTFKKICDCKYMRSKEARYFEHKMMSDKSGRLS
jgi:hypothetical protein